MARRRKAPQVKRRKHRQRNGDIITDSKYSFRFTYNGKRVTRSTNFTNKREAQAYVDKIFASDENFEKFISNTFKDQQDVKSHDPDNHGQTFLEVLKNQGWLEWKTNPKLTSQEKQGKYYGVLQAKKTSNAFTKMFFSTSSYDFFSKKNLQSITRNDAHNLSDQLWKNRTCKGVLCEENPELKETIGNYKININSLKSFFTFCYDEVKIIETNPFQGIKIPQRKNPRPKPVFSKKQLRTMFNKSLLQTISNDKRWNKFLESTYFKIFAFTALTGLRSAEVRALRWKQLSNERVLRIDSAFKLSTTNINDIGLPKCDKIRTIILCDSAYEIIKDLPKNSIDDFIFRNSRGNAVDASTWKIMFSYFLSVLIEKLDFPNEEYTPHSFRATLNSLLVNEGKIPEHLIRKYLGWSDHNTLSHVQETHYTKVPIESISKVAQAIEKIYSGYDMVWQHRAKTEFSDLRILKQEVTSILKNYNPSEGISTDKLNIIRDSIIQFKNLTFNQAENIISNDSSINKGIKINWVKMCRSFERENEIRPEMVEFLKDHPFGKYLLEKSSPDFSFFENLTLYSSFFTTH